MTAPPGIDDQVERTMLAWRRTALSLVAAGALIGHLAMLSAGDAVPAAAIVAVLLGLAAMVGHAWLSRAPSVASAGLSLTLGVVLVAGLALLTVLGN